MDSEQKDFLPLNGRSSDSCADAVRIQVHLLTHQSYRDHSKIFQDFTPQYADLYKIRLSQLKSEIKLANPGEQIVELSKMRQNDQCWVVGCLFKHMKNRKSYVKAIEEGETLQQRTQFDDVEASEDDEVFLEDSTGKRQLNLMKEKATLSFDSGLTVQAQPHNLISGLVVRVLGTLTSENEIEVREIRLPGIRHEPKELRQLDPAEPDSPSIESLLQKVSSEHKPRLAFLVGGLLVDEESGHLSDLYLLRDMLLGRVASEAIAPLLACISTVVLTGNQISFDPKLNKQLLRSYEYKDKKEELLRQINSSLKIADEITAGLAQKFNVILMPGQTDISDSFLPQRAIPSFCYPASKATQRFHTASNPAILDIGGTMVVGTDGANIQHILRLNPGLRDELEVLETCLNGRHYAPNCPETFPCFPSKQRDPLIIEHGAHVFFCGSAKKYASRLVRTPQQTIKLLATPKFSESRSAVLLDLDSLETYEYVFSN